MRISPFRSRTGPESSLDRVAAGPRQEKVAPIPMDLRRRRPRRESIEDHLTTAAFRFPHLAAETAGRSRRAWVRDLVRRKLFDGPYPVDKSSGPGRGVRFAPRDYRALLEILSLRQRGVKHRRTWLVWLWLRGRDYPLVDVRAAAAADVAATRKAMLAELNPSGRSTEPFVVKYRRNVAPQRADSPFPDLGGLDEYLAALMVRPHEAAQMSINMDDLAAMMSIAFDVPDTEMREAFRKLTAAPPEQSQQAFRDFVDLVPLGPMRTMFEALANSEPADLPQPPQLAGLLDDGRGRSALLVALKSASDEQVSRARREIQLLRTGTFESELRQAAEGAPEADAQVLLFWADWARSQRLLYRGNPQLASYFLAIHIHGEATPADIPIRSPIDVDAVLRAFRK
jgi:hypothetical protein